MLIKKETNESFLKFREFLVRHNELKPIESFLHGVSPRYDTLAKWFYHFDIADLADYLYFPALDGHLRKLNHGRYYWEMERFIMLIVEWDIETGLINPDQESSMLEKIRNLFDLGYDPSDEDDYFDSY